MSQSNSMALPAQRIGLIRRISIRFGGTKSRELERFIKFVIVGAIGAVIDLGLTNFFMKFVFHVSPDDKWPVLVSGAIGFTAAVSSNFLWNRYWTYPDSRSRRVHHQVAQFFAVNSVGLLIRLIVVQVLYVPFNELVVSFFKNYFPEAQISANLQARIAANLMLMVALVIVMNWNFFVNRYWTYGDVE
jgi:putative flippase GtrA